MVWISAALCRMGACQAGDVTAEKSRKSARNGIRMWPGGALLSQFGAYLHCCDSTLDHDLLSESLRCKTENFQKSDRYFEHDTILNIWWISRSNSQGSRLRLSWWACWRSAVSYLYIESHHHQVYFMQTVPAQVKFARELYSKIKAEFPEVNHNPQGLRPFPVLTRHQLHTLPFDEKPSGNSVSRDEWVLQPEKKTYIQSLTQWHHSRLIRQILTKLAHFSATWPSTEGFYRQYPTIWCSRNIWKLSCSRVLIHPHTGSVYKDHVELATWMGHPWPVNEQILKDNS